MTNHSLRRFAPIGLYFAGAAAVVSIALVIILRDFSLPVQVSLACIVIGLAASILMDPQGALQALTGRQARYGSNALLMTIAVIGIAVAVNYLVNGHSKQWDLTEGQQNTLTTESLNTLKSLKSPVKAEAFYPQRMTDSINNARTVLEKYQRASNGNFTFEFIDPETDPLKAKAANVTTRNSSGTIVLLQDNRQEQITSYASEEGITGALVRLANPGNRMLYFLTGHGEYPLDTSSDANYSQVKAALAAKNYTVNPLNLLSTPKIPDDALALIIAGPTKPLSQQEVDLIKAYQQKGGKLVYLADPTPTTQFGTQPDLMKTYLLENWGILLDDDMIIDPSSSQAVLVVSQRFANHPITAKMNTLVLALPIARSVRAEKSGVPQEITLTELAYTADLAWGETDFASIQANQVKADQGKDIMGPVSLGVSGENATTKARVVVIGNSRFAASGGAFDQYGNSDFILNSIDWAAAQDNLISLTAKTPVQRYIVAPSKITMGLIAFGSIFLLPGLVIIMGITTWAQRRRRG